MLRAQRLRMSRYVVGGVVLTSGLVTFGDSITAGINASTTANRWANILSTAKGLTLLNQGISGTVMQNRADSGGSPRASNGLSRYVADLLGTNKRSNCAILYGLNDLRYTAAPATMNRANFITDYSTVVAGLIAAGIPAGNIILGSPTWLPDAGYAAGSAGFTGSTRVVHESYVDAVRQIAGTYGTLYADVYRALRDGGGASLIDVDNIHPLDAGHAIIASTMGAAAAASTDFTAPTLVSATVENAAANQVVLTYNKTLRNTGTVTATAFTPSGGFTATSVAIAGAVATVTLSGSYINGDTITISYAEGGTPVEDAAGNRAGALSSQSVTNNVAGDVTPPTALSAAVANATPTIVAVTFSESTNQTITPAASAFVVSGKTVSSVAWASATVMNITCSAAFVSTDTATVGYTQPGSNNAQDLAGNLLATFSGLSVTNNVLASDTDVTAWLTRVATAGGTVSAGTKNAVTAFVTSAKSSGYWTKFRRINLFCGDQAASLVPLVNTSGSTTDTNNSTTYSESTGPVTNGTTQFINTGYTPSEATGGLSVYLRSTQTSNATIRVVAGCRDSGALQVFRITANSNSTGSASSGGVTGLWGGGGSPSAASVTTGGLTAGLWHTTRTGATAGALYKNGASVGTNAQSTTPATSAALYIFCQDSAGTAGAFSEASTAVGAYAVDSGMTSTEAAAYYTHMQTFQTALSRNV